MSKKILTKDEKILKTGLAIKNVATVIEDLIVGIEKRSVRQIEKDVLAIANYSRSLDKLARFQILNICDHKWQVVQCVDDWDLVVCSKCGTTDKILCPDFARKCAVMGILE